MTTATVDLEELQLLCEGWATIAPLIAEVRARTGLTQTQAMILYACTMLASADGDDNEDEPWRTA